MAKLIIHGDVTTVLNGNVDASNAPKIPLTAFKYGLGAGSYSEATHFGETIILDHVAHGFFNKKEKAEGYLTTPFLMGMGEEPLGSALSLEKELSILDLYKGLSGSGIGFIITGDFLFGALNGCYLKKSPIYHENINQNKKSYWEEPLPIKGVWGTIFGVVITKKKYKENILKRAFYDNPNEKEAPPFFNHTHVLGPDGARHLLTNSIVKRGDFKLFEIRDIVIFQEKM